MTLTYRGGNLGRPLMSCDEADCPNVLEKPDMLQPQLGAQRRWRPSPATGWELIESPEGPEHDLHYCAHHTVVEEQGAT